MRIWALLLVATACSKAAKDAARRDTARGDAAVAVVVPDAAPPLKAQTYPDLGSALKATIPADARVVGFGELHMRTDRKQVKSTLARFTQDGLPAISGQLSDLIVETWFVDPKCGQKAQTADAKVHMTVRRPAETKSDIVLLGEAAAAAKIQPHVMKVNCEDFEKVAPSSGDVDPDALLDLATRELARISESAVKYRDKMSEKRPWIAVYGGALHNDRFPATGVEQWTYAPKVDAASGNRLVEIDLIVPELAEAAPELAKQPWMELVKRADDKVHVWQRGERSFVVVLPRSPATPATPTTPPSGGDGRP